MLGKSTLACAKDSRCEHFKDGVHPLTAQQGPCRKHGVLSSADNHTQNQLYHIPPALCDEIAQAAGEKCAPKENDTQTSEAAPA